MTTMQAWAIISKITEYEQQVGMHKSGTFGEDVLTSIVEFAPPDPARSVETGCGKSTILLSALSQSHTCYTVDDTQESGSLPFAKQCPLFQPGRVQFVLGPTQMMMPLHPPGPELIDVALIDGPHAYPFPELEYFYIYPHLRTGALLVVDDLHIPTIGRMYEVLREDAMFQELPPQGTTGFLRRTDANVFPPLFDCWDEQKFNSRRFPAAPPRFSST